MKVSDTRINARSGLTFTALSYGGAPIGNFNGVFSEADAQAQVSQAWDQGIRYFDTAPGYGNGLSEHRLGHALRQRDRQNWCCRRRWAGYSRRSWTLPPPTVNT